MSPFYVDNPKIDGSNIPIPVPCGRCYDCKMRISRQWIFRIMQEDRCASSGHFVTLTYDTRSVPLTESGYMSLDKKDLQNYIKRLRKLDSEVNIRYYGCGEYGSKNWRPHYHLVIFNSNEVNIRKAWILRDVPIGKVHVGSVSGSSIAYTVKYMNKAKVIPRHSNDDRIPEFSLKSKGLGKRYVENKEIVRWHKADLTRNYMVQRDGYKVPLPKYYADKIFTGLERKQRQQVIDQIMEQEAVEREIQFYLKYGEDANYEVYLNDQKGFKVDKLKRLNQNRKI